MRSVPPRVSGWVVTQHWDLDGVGPTRYREVVLTSSKFQVDTTKDAGGAGTSRVCGAADSGNGFARGEDAARGVCRVWIKRCAVTRREERARAASVPQVRNSLHTLFA